MTTLTEYPDDIDENARIVMLTYGRMQNGKDSYWCYVAVKPGEYDRFMGVLKSGKMDLHKFADEGFGEVLVSGPGLYPPQDITKEVARAFNVPIRDLFGDVDPRAVMAQKIAQMKGEAGQEG